MIDIINMHFNYINKCNIIQVVGNSMDIVNCGELKGI